MASGPALPPASSPLSSPPPSQSFSKEDSGSAQGTRYRQPIQLPFELAQHVQTYYEESLFSQAFNFLLSITGNTASSTNRRAPVMLPPTSHLALAATIAVHPSFTTRTHSREKWDQANAALRLLRLVHATVGPVNANFAAAFSFRKYDFRSSRHAGNSIEYEDGDLSQDEHASTGHDLNTPYGGSQALWIRAEDFWHVVGWTLNCACLAGIHLSRWNSCSLLLEFMIDVLETDWDICKSEANSSPEESLIWQYIELAAGGHAKARRILRAIFADGSSRSTSEFRAIFSDELKEPLADGKLKKREVDVDIEQDIYGDYMAGDDSDFSDDGDAVNAGTGSNCRPGKRMRTRTRTPSSRRLTPQSTSASLRNDHESGDDSGVSNPASKLADPTSLGFRLRLMRLLVQVSSHPTLTSTSPTTFPDLEDLLTLFVEFTKPLPLPVFAQIVLPSAALQCALPLSDAPSSVQAHVLEPQTLTLFCESLLQRILENSSPSLRSHVLLSQSKLENEYLPFAAARNSVDANARISLLLEALTRCLHHLGVLKKTEALKDALSKGVEKRLGRVAELGDGKRSKKVQTEEQEIAWAWLVESGERMTKLVDGLEN